MQVPLLVYEFITWTILYDFIHDDGLGPSLSWYIFPTVATETAEVLGSMRSSDIIHGTVCHCILLDHMTPKCFALHQPIL